mgnify:FL=1
MTFVEPIPDGSVLAPHHFYLGVFLAWFALMFVWWIYPRTRAALTLLGLLIALDDAVQHAFSVHTPLHHLWWGVLYPIVRFFESM